MASKPVAADLDLMVRKDAEIREAMKVLQSRQFKGKEAKALRLPPLLERRRKEHLVPNGCFREQPMFDWVHLYQLGDSDEVGPKTYAGTSIHMPDRSRDTARDESPRGLLVAAGPLAMDELRSNGCDIGHIVRFIRLAPFRIIVDNVLGRDFTILVMRSGSITASQDLEDAKREGRAKLVHSNVGTKDKPEWQHVWQIKDKKTAKPRKPWEPADYSV